MKALMIRKPGEAPLSLYRSVSQSREKFCFACAWSGFAAAI